LWGACQGTADASKPPDLLDCDCGIDGSLLFVDDKNNRVWRVTYTGK
jgi:glucose/arabinose dehydrogenase